jgi:predicted negative regulator of RcsB-dependent stress response
MTSVRTEPDSSVAERASAADRAQTFLDWTRINSKYLTAGAVVVVIAAAGFWFWQRQQQIEANNAARALMNAKQSMSAGNLQLAQSDLQNVYNRYGSTASGVEAAMLLAQISYDAGKPQDGISRLQKVEGTRAGSAMAATLQNLEGDGYAQMGKLSDAAKHYEAASDQTGLQLEKAFYKAKAARTYQSAGDTAKARLLWTALADDPTAQSMSSEARVRLGELTTVPAKK